jgi:hypothetical protein
VWRSWHTSLQNDVAYKEIYERDRYRCTSPVCSCRHGTPHHLKYRSKGGDDSRENVTTLCLWCHLEGVHGGRMKVSPPASRMRFVMPLMTVEGRERAFA